MNDDEGSVPTSGHVGLKGSGSPPRGPCRGGERVSHWEGSILSSGLVGLEHGGSPSLGSGRNCESENAVVLSGFLEISWAGHKLSIVFGDSLRSSARMEFGGEDPGAVGGRREGSGQGSTVRAFGIISRRLSLRRGHCSSRTDRQEELSGLGVLSGEILGLGEATDGSLGNGVCGGGVPAKN